MKNNTKIAVAAAGITAIAGIGLSGAAIANAATNSAPTYGSTSGYGSGSAASPSADGRSQDWSKPMRGDEKLLTGDVAAKVTAAAKAKEPTATVERVETDSDGVYEAHMKRADGTQIIVQVNKSYAVTGVQTMGQGGGHHGDGDGDGPKGAPGSSSSSGATS